MSTNQNVSAGTLLDLEVHLEGFSLELKTIFTIIIFWGKMDVLPFRQALEKYPVELVNA